MPGNSQTRYQYLGTSVNGNRGFATLVREGDHEQYEIPIEWIPGNMKDGVMVEVTTDDESGTITIKPIEGSGPRISTAVTGGH